MLRRLTAALAGLLLASTLTACSGSGGLDGSYHVEDALAELPDVSGDEELVVVRTADLEAASELGEVDPDDDDWLRSLFEDPLFVAAPLTTERQRDTGVELPDVSSFSSLQIGGGETLDVLRLREGDAPSDDGDVDGLARAGEDDKVALATDDALLDRWRDRDDTLADDDHFGGLAQALDDHDVYAAVLYSAPAEGGVRALGVGQAVEDGEAVEYAAFALAEDEDVDERAQEIEDAWRATQAAESGRLEVEEVDTGGQVVVVTLRPDEAGETYRALVTTLDFRLPS